MIRIAICGLHIESSTFTPYMSTAADFTQRRGQTLLERYPWITESPIPGIDQVPRAIAGEEWDVPTKRPWNHDVEWVPILHCSALPGGPVERLTYEKWRAEICDGLAKSGHVDGIFFDIHGAMSVPGYDDVEGDLISAIRDVVGPEPMVSASMDLHGNVSEKLFAGCDLLTCYRMAPHEDAWVSRERAARTLCERLRSGKGKPIKAMVTVPILLPGEKTSTRIEPAASLYDMVPEVAAHDGVTDVGVWIGFAWADQPRCTAAVVGFGDDENHVRDGVSEIAQFFWKVRREFVFVAPTDGIEQAVDRAVASSRRPFVISDSGDNPGAGGADDVTIALSVLLAHPEITGGELSAIHASIYDPQVVKRADEAGVGGMVEVDLGGHVDTRKPGPIHLSAQVRCLVDDPGGLRTAVLGIGGLSVIVTTRRDQYTTLEQFERVQLDPRTTDIVVVKIGYLEPDLYDLAADWIMALTPGGVDQDLMRLGHNHLRRPIFPFDEDMQDPDLTVTTS